MKRKGAKHEKETKGKEMLKRFKKKPVDRFEEKPEAIVVPAPVEEVKSIVEGVPLCECGEPVAEGQTFVCHKHIRTN